VGAAIDDTRLEVILTSGDIAHLAALKAALDSIRTEASAGRLTCGGIPVPPEPERSLAEIARIALRRGVDEWLVELPTSRGG